MATMLPVTVDPRVAISFSAPKKNKQIAELKFESRFESDSSALKAEIPAMNRLSRPLGASQRPAPNHRRHKVPRPENAVSDRRDIESRLRDSLNGAGKKMLVGQFVKELGRLLEEQSSTLPLLPTTRDWALKNLHRQYFAIRTAGELLGQPHLAVVAERAEVLTCLLSQKYIAYKSIHLEVFRDTHKFLQEITQQIGEQGDDSKCVTTASIALCLFAAVEPTSRSYTPVKIKFQITQSDRQQ